MKTLNKNFTDKDLELIAIALSHLGGQLADDNENYIGSSCWKSLWNLQEYFNKKANES